MVEPRNPPDRYVPIETTTSNTVDNRILARRTRPRRMRISIPTIIRIKVSSIRMRSSVGVRIKAGIANNSTTSKVISKIVLSRLAICVFSSSPEKTGGEKNLRKRAHIPSGSIAITSYLQKRMQTYQFGLNNDCIH